MGKNKIIVIGGGASGLMAGITAARKGAKVTILERKDRVGKKILATGNGRCNISNRAVAVSKYHASQASNQIVDNMLNSFSVQDTIDFFNKIGLLIIEGNEGKLYPRSLQAASVVNVLLKELENLGVEVITSAEVKGIQADKNFKVQTNDKTYYCNKLILAAGGKSAPDLGSNGSGFKLANALGHSIVQPFPSLVQLKTDFPYLKHLKGTKIDGTVCISDENQEVLREESGEVLFTDYGLSGPPILQLSRIGAMRLLEGRRTYITVDIMPEYSETDLDTLLISRFQNMPKKTAEEGFIGLIHSRLIVPILKASQIDLTKKLTDINKAERKILVNNLKCIKMKVTGTNQWNQSQVTAGGVSINEINEISLESRRVNGLFFCGEVIDIDGDCGGYNLQWAISSGAVAGLNAAKGDK